MDVQTIKPCRLISAEKRKFTNTTKQEVEYTEAKIFDGNDIFKCSIASDIEGALIGQKELDGSASFSVTQQNGKTKLKLINFEV